MNVLTKSPIEMEFPRKFKRVLISKKRVIVLVGGRSSAKSTSVAQWILSVVEMEGSDVLCGREFQSSIEDSVHKLLSNLIEKHNLVNAAVTDKKIDFNTPRGLGRIRYKGFARNSSAVRSAEDYKRSWVEEAQYLSQQSIDDLMPTIRKGGSQLIFTANLMASNDPFSKRFIVPFKKQLDRDGFYEDHMHLIIVMNWRDNPWWNTEMEMERKRDFETRPRAEYDHIWEGAFNDSVENSIIKTEWFDAAIDSHIKIGFKPTGFKVVSHDPSDLGGDSKGLVLRHGSVILDVQEKSDGDVNEGCDWATGFAIEKNADLFVWDGDGLGVSLRREVANALDGKKIEAKMFKGSESPWKPDSIYEPIEMLDIQGQRRTNKDTFLNKRAQYYWWLRERFFKTYLAVEKKQYINPDELISISSGIECLSQFRSEVCRIPRKSNGNGKIQIMAKDEMKNKLKILSPNLADSVMMAMEIPVPIHNKQYEKISIPNLKRL